MLSENDYNALLTDIGQTLLVAREAAYIAINKQHLEAYWNIGKYITDYELGGKEKANYGSKLYVRLSKDLTARFGRGFSRTNIYQMRQFYAAYPIVQSLTGRLTWTHYGEILSIENPTERAFYEAQCAQENWSVRLLKRQISSGLYQRSAVAQIGKSTLELSTGQQAKDIIKDPYILEFLGLPENQKLAEKTLEYKLIKHLQEFLMELGRGFSFVSQQFRITLDNTHFYVDLVFYHHILKCFVLIDLKTRKVQHNDIGQMNMYLNFFKIEQNAIDDNPPIGIVLCANKDDILVEYALGGITNNLFVSKYLLHLPNKDDLQKRLNQIMDNDL
jgi:predicted nuclease of restriction endonuclease-like (RecB) superfamily